VLPVEQFESKLKSEGAAKKTLQFYLGPVRKFANHCPKSLSELTADDVYAFRDSLEFSDYAKHNHIRAIKFFLKRMDVKLDIKLPSFTPPAPDEYQAEHLKRLFAFATDRERRLFMFFLCTGCREGEVMHAMWENLTRDSYTVRSVDGWRPKKNKTRTIPIPDALSKMLEPVRKTGLIFPNIHGGPDGHMLKKLQALAKRSGQDPTAFCLQRFRRTFATTHLRNGATVHEVAGFLGHSNLDTVMRYLSMANASSARIRSLANSAFAGV
jgi:integrase